MPALRRALPRPALLLGLLLALLPLAAPGAPTRAGAKAAAGPNDSEQALYIVQLRGEPLATSAGVPRRRDKGAAGDARPDLASPQARARAAQLDARRQSALADIARALGAPVDALYSYDTAFNGVALRLTGAEAARVADLPAVRAVRRSAAAALDSDAGPQWIGAGAVWDGSAAGVYAATILGANQQPPVSSPLRGRGTFTLGPAGDELAYTVVVAGLAGASPITQAHIRRAADDSVVAALAPAGPGSYAGSVALSPADAALLRSDGLYVNLHTAANPGGEARGDIAGYKGEGVVIGVIDTGINTGHPSFAAVGGDGYRHLNPLGAGVYKGACDPANLPSAADGNPSGYNPLIPCNDKLIGAWTFPDTAAVPSPAGEPSPNDDDGHGSHTASTAAGNVLLGVTANSVTYPRISGVAPHANLIAYDVCGYYENGARSRGCPDAAMLAAIDQAVADGVDVINFSISGTDNPWDSPVEAAFRSARAAGIVVSTSAGNRGPGAGTVGHMSPWLMAVASATHNRTVVNGQPSLSAASGDIMARTSSRGPAVGGAAALIKPDLTAPGVSVIAAVANNSAAGADYAQYSGTSMASPHAAGAAALLAGLHPGWTPGQIQSALMTTALAPLRKEDAATPTTPFDSGAGRIRLEGAARAGMLLDESAGNFISANPATGGDPRTLNIPSMADPACVATCAWTRTVRNPLGVPVSWTASTDSPRLTVAPASFTIPAGGAQSFTVTYDAAGLPTSGAYVFGRVTFSAGGGLAPDAAFPLAARPTVSDLPGAISFSGPSGVAATTRQIKTVAYGSLDIQRYGPVKGTPAELALGETETHITTLAAPAGTARLVAEIASSPSLDIDLYVYRDGGDGAYDSDDAEVCRSATTAVLESCNLSAPVAGTYFVKVENYDAAGAGPDPVQLVTAVVPDADTGGLTVSAPASSAGGPFPLGVGVRLAGSQLGDRWYGGFSLAAGGTSLGATLVDFHHELGAPAALDAAGAPLSATVAQPFGAPLAVVVTDGGGNPVPGVPVSFSAPAAGASAVLSAAGGVTDADGRVSVTAVANKIAGAYSVTASAAGPGGPLTASFSMTNSAGPPAQLAASGQAQTAGVGRAFAAPLAVVVRDDFGNPVPGAAVSFSAPAAGASAALTAPSATTDAGGRASVGATANRLAGTYSVTASAAGASGPVTTTFSLTNVAAPAPLHRVFLPALRR